MDLKEKDIDSIISNYNEALSSPYLTLTFSKEK